MTLSSCPTCPHSWDWHDVDGCASDCACRQRGKWQIVVDSCGRPTTTNRTHNLHPQSVSRDRKVWRTAGCILARQAKIPQLPAITVECWGEYPSSRSLPDADAVAPALKGVLDGLVDAGVVPDDRGEFVPAITYRRPVVRPGATPALVVQVKAMDR